MEEYYLMALSHFTVFISGAKNIQTAQINGPSEKEDQCLLETDWWVKMGSSDVLEPQV